MAKRDQHAQRDLRDRRADADVGDFLVPMGRQERRAIARECGPGGYLVYSVLKGHTDAEGIARIGQRRIASEASLSQSGVVKILAQLEHAGWIGVVPGTGHQQRHAYRVGRDAVRQPIQLPVRCPNPFFPDGDSFAYAEDFGLSRSQALDLAVDFALHYGSTDLKLPNWQLRYRRWIFGEAKNRKTPEYFQWRDRAGASVRLADE